MTPQPIWSRPLDPGAVYGFPTAGAGTRMNVMLSLEPGRIGPARCRIETVGERSLNIRQFILP
jgi:hypothetical protein